MKIAKYVFLIAFFLTILLPCTSHATAPMKFDFELGNKKGWDIPDWAFEQKDHVARSTEISKEKASEGEASLKINCEFPGDKWTAALIEYNNELDLTQYDGISADIFLPKNCKSELIQARIIMTVGDGWWICQMKGAVLLKKGAWTTITAKLKDPSAWICRAGWENVSGSFNKVKKIAIRIEYNANPWQAGPPYNGPVYVDNIVIQ